MNMRTILMTLVCGVALMGCGEKESDDTAPSSDDSAASDDSGTCDFTATCSTFCADSVATCADNWGGDAAACEADCATWADGCDGDTSGDTLACRTYHLGAAADDAATHCPHAGADGGGVCVD